MQERLAYIALNQMSGLGPVGVGRLISAWGSPQVIWTASEEELRSVQGIGEKTAQRILRERDAVNPEQEEERALSQGIRLLTPLDAEYPSCLSSIHNPPLVLYVQGSFEPRMRGH